MEIFDCAFVEQASKKGRIGCRQSRPALGQRRRLQDLRISSAKGKYVRVSARLFRARVARTSLENGNEV